VVPFSAQLTEAAAVVQGFQLNFTQSHVALQVTDWATNATDFPLLLDSELQGDSFVASASLAGVSAPPSVEVGSFQVTAPLAAGDYTLTVHAISGNELTDTMLTDLLGQALEIGDFGDAIIRIRGWHNTLNPYDVTDQGGVTAEDALTVINYINSHPGQAVLPTSPLEAHPFYDVNNEGRATPLDALIVINYINSHPAGAGEGEAVGEQGQVSVLETWASIVQSPNVMLGRLDHTAPAVRMSAIDTGFSDVVGRMPEDHFAADSNAGGLRIHAHRGLAARPASRMLDEAVFNDLEPLVVGLDGVLQDIAGDVDRVWNR
jgi:hypothetical protein